MEPTLTKRLDILTEQIKKLQNSDDDRMVQLDKDRVDIDRIRVDMARISAQQDAILKTMVDFKSEVRQIVQDTVREEVPKAVKKELEKIEMANPRKVFVINQGPIGWITSLFKKKK